jgi:predicted 2-oxoglutarate/Fe(II)-dependent dioxygenase YbiX
MDFTQKHHEAAILLAEDELGNAAIAERVGVDERTIYRWKEDKDFRKLIDKYVKDYARRIFNRGIARKDKRVKVLDEVHEKIQTVFRERGESEEMQVVPGGKTGLLVKQFKGIGRGEDFEMVEEFAVDTGTIRELRALQEQVASELGQRISKIEHSGPDGGPLVIQDARAKLLAKLASASGSIPATSGSGENPENPEPNE